MEECGNILTMEDIVKIYPNGVIANDKVNFSVHKGEIHALMGENGAGKSTLMKILFGIEQPESGTIRFNGQEVKLTSSNHAIALGIGMVHQHFKLVPSLTVAENIVLGSEPRKGLGVDRQAALKTASELSKKFGFDLDPSARIEGLSVGKKQKVEILKAIYRNARLLILDEPTAVLAPQETEELFQQLEQMRESGITVIFISHKLGEIKRICQRMTIMRAGKSMGTYNVEDLNQEEISRLMVGREVILKVEKEPAQPGDVCLHVNGLTHINEVKRQTLADVSFSLRKGEILGIAGVEGAGQKELVELITGMQDLLPNRGHVELDGIGVGALSVKERRSMGLAYIPEDRVSGGVAVGMAIRDNLISNVYDQSEYTGHIMLRRREIDSRVSGNIKDFDIRCKDANTQVTMLSGGNMQKVVIARELSGSPGVLVADQPTRGVDVGAIEFIHKKIIEIRDKGCGVLLVSADLNEILELSDSIIVMYQGTISAYFPYVKDVTEAELGYYMLGVKQQGPELLKEVCHESV